MRLPSLAAVPVALVTLLAPALARADDACAAEARAFDPTDPALASPKDKQAAQHVREGNKRHRVLKYAEAIEAYVAAALVDSAPSIHYNLGQSYRLSGQYENAIRQYRLFLDRGAPGPGVRALVECHIASMTAELRRSAATAPPTGPAPDDDDVAVRTAPAGPAAATDATLTLDGPLPSEPWYTDSVGLGLAGGGAVIAGIGTWLLVDAAGLYDEANREDRDYVRTELRADADTRETWGIAAAAVGGAALIAGVVKLALTPDAPRERSVALWWGPSGIGVRGQF